MAHHDRRLPLDSTSLDGALLVRGCVRQDLEGFVDFAVPRGAQPAVVESSDADYGFRFTTSRELLAALVAEPRSSGRCATGPSWA